MNAQVISAMIPTIRTLPQMVSALMASGEIDVGDAKALSMALKDASDRIRYGAQNSTAIDSRHVEQNLSSACAGNGSCGCRCSDAKADSEAV